MIDAATDDYRSRCPPMRCPMGLAQRPCKCIGYREREQGRLQLRIVMSSDEGICDAIAEETDECVYVRVILCYDEATPGPTGEYADCPTHVYLEQPLGDRAVIDAFTGREVPTFTPA
jgi:hypothetical protein